MPFVLDASVALAWHFEDEFSAYADSMLAHLQEDEGVVPFNWPLELSNGLLAGERRARITPNGTLEALQESAELSISIRDATPLLNLSRVLELARAQSLTAYDATYLELAMREGLPLATLDTDLRDAALRTGVRLAE